MPIEFRCRECDNLLRTPDNSVGKTGRCPSCKATMVIPDVHADDEHADPTGDEGANFGVLASPFAQHETAVVQSDSGEIDQPPTRNVDSPPPRFEPSPANVHSHPSETAEQRPSVVPQAPMHPAEQSHFPYRPHRGSLVFILGLLGMLLSMFSCCMAWGCTIPIAFSGAVMGAIAAIVGHLDLREFRANKLDPSGRDLTMAGYVMGIIACCLFAFVFGIMAISIVSTVVIGVMNGQ